jgi:hypothetical protein
VVKFDSTGDGIYNWRQTIRRYELLFRNRETDARLSLSVFPIEQQLENTDLKVLAREYVDAASGAGAVEVDWGDERKEVAEEVATAPAEGSVETRLEKLKSLHARGLISDEEYQSKRAAILDSI